LDAARIALKLARKGSADHGCSGTAATCVGAGLAKQTDPPAGGFAPGGGTDIVARALRAAKMSDQCWGSRSWSTNRPGAAGTIAADLTAKSPAAGYTLLIGAFELERDRTFRLFSKLRTTLRRISPRSPTIRIRAERARGSSVGAGAKTVAELVDLAKAKPASTPMHRRACAAPQHLAGALFAKLTDTQLNHIPYKAAARQWST